MIENIPPYAHKIRFSLRLKQRKKHHFTDPSISCDLLHLTEEKLSGDLELLGFLFESLVERNLLIYAENRNATIYHYQDYKNRERDALIERDDGSWCGIEIKLSGNLFACMISRTND